MHNTLGAVRSLPPADLLKQQNIFLPRGITSFGILGGNMQVIVGKFLYKHDDKNIAVILKCSNEENSANTELETYAVRSLNIVIAC
jgi:hypothetical protein